MQQNKGKKNLSEIAKYCTKDNIFLKTCRDILKGLDLRYINRLLSQAKVKGVDSAIIFQLLFVFQYFDIRNTYQYIGYGKAYISDIKKDVFYDFMKNPRIDWRKIVLLFLRQVLKYIDKKSVDQSLGSKERLSFFILDDSILEKTGRTIEAVGMVYDHCLHGWKLGMKLLTLGLWDGKSFFPVDFSIHNEPGKNGKRGLRKKELDKQFVKDRAENTPGYRRVQEIATNKISMAITLISNAMKMGVTAKYVLADSWFICESFLTGIKDLSKDMHVIGLMKTNRNITIDNKTYKISSVPELKRREKKYSKKYKAHYIMYDAVYKDITIKGYWVKMKGNTSWKLLVSTDQSLKFNTAMQHYQIRWSIEVYFKDCKQNLGLNNCQSVDMDSYFAHISLTMMNYMVLSIKKRFEDYESIGGIFRDSKAQVLENTLVEKMWEIIIEIYLLVFAALDVDMDRFMLIVIQLEKSAEDLMKSSLAELVSVNKRAA
jgi:hypothetical protein